MARKTGSGRRISKSNGTPQVSGRPCEVSGPHGGVTIAFYVYSQRELPRSAAFFLREAGRGRQGTRRPVAWATAANEKRPGCAPSLLINSDGHCLRAGTIALGDASERICRRIKRREGLHVLGEDDPVDLLRSTRAVVEHRVAVAAKVEEVRQRHGVRGRVVRDGRSILQRNGRHPCWGTGAPDDVVSGAVTVNASGRDVIAELELEAGYLRETAGGAVTVTIDQA